MNWLKWLLHWIIDAGNAVARVQVAALTGNTVYLTPEQLDFGIRCKTVFPSPDGKSYVWIKDKTSPYMWF